MEVVRRRFMQLAAGAVAAPYLSRPALARAYPTKPVRIVAGFPQGGAIDIAARFISPWLSERLNQPFTVENLPGESGNVATSKVVNEVADGHTLLLCGPVNTINTTLFEGALSFNFSRDIAAVGGLYRVPLVVVINPSVPARSVGEFLAYAKGNPGKLKVAYAGRGTPQHVGIELFKQMAGIDLTLVPYPGSTPALADLLSGQAHVMFDPIPSSIGHVKSGKLVALAVTASAPSFALPDVPLMSNFVPGYEAGSWFGLGAPRNTPTSIIDALNAEINAGLADAKMKAQLAELEGTAMAGSAEEFSKFIVGETEKFAKVVRAANITR